MRLRHRIAAVAALTLSSFVVPVVAGVLANAHAMSIDCVKHASGGYLCEVIHDNGVTEYFSVAP